MEFAVPKKNRLMVSSTLTERRVEDLIRFFAIGFLPRDVARATGLSVPTCYRVHRYMLVRLYAVGWLQDDEEMQMSLGHIPDGMSRLAEYKARVMKQHRGFEKPFTKELENRKYNSLFLHAAIYEQVHTNYLYPIESPTDIDLSHAWIKTMMMVANDLIRIVRKSGPLNANVTGEQLMRAREDFLEGINRKIMR